MSQEPSGVTIIVTIFLYSIRQFQLNQLVALARFCLEVIFLVKGNISRKLTIFSLRANLLSSNILSQCERLQQTYFFFQSRLMHDQRFIYIYQLSHDLLLARPVFPFLQRLQLFYSNSCRKMRIIEIKRCITESMCSK